MYRVYDFDWFINLYVKKYEKALIRESKKSKNLLRFYQEYKTDEEKQNEFKNEYVNTKEEFKNKKINKCSNAVNAYLNSHTDDEKICALNDMNYKLVSFDPTSVLKDAESNNKDLSNAALRVINTIRDTKVKEWVTSKINEDIYKYLPIYLNNYEDKDSPIVLELLKDVEFSFSEEHAWHDIVSAILNMRDNMLIPKELLLYVYENSYCGTCRASAFNELKRRRLLTKEIINECNYDACSDIFYKM